MDEGKDFVATWFPGFPLLSHPVPGYEKLYTGILMEDHWLTCLKIPQSDGYGAIVLPETTKEPAPRMKLTATQKGDRGRARTVPLLPRSARVADGELDDAILDTSDIEPDA